MVTGSGIFLEEGSRKGTVDRREKTNTKRIGKGDSGCSGSAVYRKMVYEKEIVKTIQKLSGKYSLHTVFMDWVARMAISIQNSCTLLFKKTYQDRERKYLDIIGKYDPSEQQHFAEMFAMLISRMEEGEMDDVLGTIYMQSGCGNKNRGQFFTPFHLSLACAQLVIDGVEEAHPLHLHEPCVGSGGMIIAAAKALKEKGVNYQKCMKVVAQDLDCNCVHMSYVQLSLYGIDGIVVQGDTLVEPFTDIKTYPPGRVWITPKKAGMFP